MKLKKENNCSIFLTAGYPKLDSTVKLAIELEKAGADLIELGIPFSDPMADGPVIQESSAIALKNGMTLPLLLEQVKEIKKVVSIPIVLMGYLNPVYQYGLEAFLKACSTIGVDGLILPDLSVEVYERSYQDLFEKYDVPLTFLITPTTSEKRIRKIERHTKTFVYLVSTSSITGKKNEFSEEQIKGFERIKQFNLSVPVLVGFGIHNNKTFSTVCDYFDGAIIGSAFIRSLAKGTNVNEFIDYVKKNKVLSIES